MIVHYIKVSARALWRNKSFATISILGLALGLAMGMFSMAYLIRETSWEDLHRYKDRIYRVEMQYQHMDTAWSSARVMAPLGSELAASIPAIDKIAVFRHHRTARVTIDQKTSRAGRLIFAQPEFFEVFTMPLKSGDPDICLKDPGSILLTDTIAKTYFPNQNPIGQSIVVDDDLQFTVTGILENIPGTTQLYCDFVASYATLETAGADLTSWTDSRSDLTYLLVHEEADPAHIEQQIRAIFSRNVGQELGQRYTFTLKALKDIYYDTYFSGNRGELLPGWEPDMVIFLLAIGFLILFQSIVNFISLSTARAADRMKEVGIRKTIGAGRGRLILQFLCESLIITTAAMLLGLVAFEIIKIGYNGLGLSAFEKTYELANLYDNWSTISLIVLLMVSVGFVAGFFPSLYLSRFRPVVILRDSGAGRPSKSIMRRVLVAFQFVLAIFFITVTAGLYQQLKFITGYDLGFDQQDMMVLRFTEDDLNSADCAIAKRQILARNKVVDASRSNRSLGSRFWSQRLYTGAERTDSTAMSAKYFEVDYNFLSFYGIELLEGRGFSENNPDDIRHSVIINESLRDDLDLSEPVGYRLYTDSSSLEIMGVVKDFQGTAMDWSYGANSVLVLDPEVTRVLCIKLRDQDISGTVAGIKDTWEQVFPGHEFRYSFLADDIRANYRETDSMIAMFGVLSMMSIVIACLGTFGLVTYTVRRRSKETAIRKVLGATVATIFGHLISDFLILIAIASVIAGSLGYWLVTLALEEYPYQASIGLGTCLIGGGLILILVLAASAYHVTEAARANPVKALRFE